MIFQLKNSSFEFFKKEGELETKYLSLIFFPPRKWRQKFAKRSH